jgi:hypothetical protein
MGCVKPPKLIHKRWHTIIFSNRYILYKHGIRMNKETQIDNT